MQICRLAKAIGGFGFNIPIVIDRELRVVAGRGRLLAAQELGWSEVPTIRLDDLSPAQARFQARGLSARRLVGRPAVGDAA
jgi:ParB-like chromosome segregation protein Spo0J